MKSKRSFTGLFMCFWILTIFGLFSAAALAEEKNLPLPVTVTPGPSSEIMEYQDAAKMEIYRLRIVNDENGEIVGSKDEGKTWEVLGHVLKYTEKVNDQGYTASKWAKQSVIAATAVNAIHISTGYNEKQDKGIVFSLLPKEMASMNSDKVHSYLSQDSSIYTDIPAGKGIFGGHWAPILANPVFIEKGGELSPLPIGYIPAKGDILTVKVLEPVNMPRAIIFENRFGGFITMENWDGTQKVIGQVLRPVEGIGRFTGTNYADVGRIRANHNGVICISTSSFGEIAGFQIIPRDHAMSPEMEGARIMTQWMVVGPLDARDPSWEGIAPLFRDYLRPSWSADDLYADDWVERMTDRIMVDVRIKNGDWQLMPRFSLDPDYTKPLAPWANTALKDITHIRILMPLPKSYFPAKETTPIIDAKP